VPYAFSKTLGNASLRPTTLRCLFSIFYNFFFSQFCAALFPSRIPVSRVDHPLDLKIPFLPVWVKVYADFTSFWIRVLTFMIKNCGRRSFGAVREFIASIGELYAFVAKVYRKNLSTTNRPFYIARPSFFIIHSFDPHLMCIPSLHVMVAVFSYMKFAATLRVLGAAEKYAAQIEEMRLGALAICRSILFVKQHSVNCIGASIYAMTHFAPELFPREEAEVICAGIFKEPPPARIPEMRCIRVAGARASCGAIRCKTCPFSVPMMELPAADIAEITAHITDSYRHFFAEGKKARSWEEPLLNFLRGLLPQK